MGVGHADGGDRVAAADEVEVQLGELAGLAVVEGRDGLEALESDQPDQPPEAMPRSAHQRACACHLATANNRARAEGSAEVLFPMPFIKDRSSLRSALFFDVGNVFNTNCRENQVNCFGIDAGELRYSVGIGVTWLSGFGPLTFSLAKPLNASQIDEREVFQFTLGRGF